MTGTMELNSIASEDARSIIAAAYLFLCVANGRQDRSSRVLVLFGQNHIDDMAQAFEHFVLNCTSIAWVRKRSRGYFTMTSQKAQRRRARRGRGCGPTAPRCGSAPAAPARRPGRAMRASAARIAASSHHA